MTVYGGNAQNPLVADSNTESLFSFGTRLPKVAVTLQALRNTLKSQLIVVCISCVISQYARH